MFEKVLADHLIVREFYFLERRKNMKDDMIFDCHHAVTRVGLKLDR